jgi:hypothetical protein
MVVYWNFKLNHYSNKRFISANRAGARGAALRALRRGRYNGLV